MSNANVDFNFQVDESPQFNVYPCTDQQCINLNDINNGNYANGYVNFSGSNLIGSSAEKQFAFSEAILHIPYTVTLTASAGTFTTDGSASTQQVAQNLLYPENAFAVGMKGSHHFIDSATIKYGGVGITQNSSFQNFYMNERLKEMTTQEHRIYGDLMGHEWDNPDSYNFTTTAAGLTYESNNKIKPSLEAANLIHGLVPSTFYNDGHYKRMQKSNTDINNPNSTYFKLIGSASNTSKNGQACLVSSTSTTLTYEGFAYIPLAQVSDFFAKMPTTSASSSFELKLQTNIASSNSYTVNYASAIAGSTTPGPTNIFNITGLNSVQSIGKTCPFMISQAGCGAGTGLSIRPTPVTPGTPAIGDLATVTMTMAIGNKSGLPCKLVIPVISFTPNNMASILRNPTSRILYNDYYADQILGVAGGTNVVRNLSAQVSRARRLFIIPFLSTTQGNSTGPALIAPYTSPISSAPTTSSMCRLSNFQLQIGGTNIMSEQLRYNFDFYNSNYMELACKINGNSTKSLFFSGMITKSMWEKCYGTYVFNIEKCTDEQYDNNNKQITVNFKLDTMNVLPNGTTPLYYDFLIFTEYQKETYLNRILGSITSTASA